MCCGVCDWGSVHVGACLIVVLYLSFGGIGLCWLGYISSQCELLAVESMLTSGGECSGACDNPQS